MRDTVQRLILLVRPVSWHVQPRIIENQPLNIDNRLPNIDDGLPNIKNRLLSIEENAHRTISMMMVLATVD